MLVTQQSQRSHQQRNAIIRWLSVAVLAFAISAEPFAAPDIEAAFPAATNLVTNGPVLASASFGSNSGETTGLGVGLDAATALINPRFPKVAGGASSQIYAVIEDGFGGWVIGGDFDTVGGVALRNLAHIQADLSVNSAWRPNPDGVVRALLFHTGSKGLRLLVGGDFTQIHGEARSYFAELHTGSISKPVTSLDLFIDAPVHAIAKADETLVYIAGEFTVVRGTGPRDDDGDGHLDVDINGWVKVDMDGDGVFETSMNIVGDGVNDIDVDGDGDIDIDVTLDGVVDADINVDYSQPDPAPSLDVPFDQTYPQVSRQRIAALDLDAESNGMVVDEWNPNADGVVRTIALAPERSKLYVGGDFLNISVGSGANISRQRIAALNTANNINIITTWNPGGASTNSIYAMYLEEFGIDNESGEENGLLYVGGDFTEIGGKSRQNFAVLDIALAVNNANAWDLQFDDVVLAIARADETFFIGGAFNSVTIEGVVESDFKRLAAFRRGPGTLITAWNPDVNGDVSALAASETTGIVYAGGKFNSVGDTSRLYIGGDFTYIGPSTGSGVVVDTSAGIVQSGWPEVNGDVYAAISDGSDGWYIGGSFSEITDSVSTYTRNNVAHISSAGTVTSWDPSTNGAVHAMAVNGTSVYIGGDFTTIGGQARNNIALTDSSGTTTSWDPGANGVVRTLAVSGTSVYAGGDFTTIGGQARNHVALIDSSGTTTSWDPGANGVVRTLAVSGTSVYAGGDFTTIGGQARNHVALIDNSGATTSWDPGANGVVRTLAVSGTSVYAGGDFTTIGGQARNHVALIDNSGAAASWDPNADAPVSELLFDSGTVYVGGDFSFIGSLLRNRAAAFTVGSSVATAWAPSVGNSVHALSPGAAGIFIGGAFSSVGGVTRERIAAIDLSSGGLDASFNVGTNARITTMQLSGDGTTLYVGGEFTSVGGQPRNHIAALNTETGAAYPWNPDINGTTSTTAAYDIELSAAGDLLYVGGAFETIGGVTRNNLGAISVEDGDVAAWDPSADGAVYTIQLSGDTLLVGGDFLNMNTNGQNISRMRLAALNTEEDVDNATPWAPAADATVRDMALAGSTLYIGGDFTQINDSGFTRSRNYLAALDTAANAFNLLGWNPDANGRVHAIALTDDAVFVGGDFTSIGGATPRERLAALDFLDGNPLAWWDLRASSAVPAGASATVRHLGISEVGDRMIISGDFREITTTAPTTTYLRQGLTAVDIAFPHMVTNPPAGAYQVAQSVTMSCIDVPKSCTQSIYYTVNSTADPVVSGSPPSQSILISDNTTLKMLTEDDAGNQSGIQSSLYIIDSLPPETTATPAGRGTDGKILNNSDDREITLDCVDSGGAGCAETYYTLDGSNPTDSSIVYTGPIELNENTTLKYISFDQARNDETAGSGIKEDQYWVDLTPPTVAPDPPTGVFYSADLSVTLLCSDDPDVTPASIGDIPDASDPPDPNDPPITGTPASEDNSNRTATGCSGVYYTLDDTTPTINSTLYTGPITFSESTIIKFIAIDHAGNEGVVERASYVRNYSDNAGSAGPIGLILLLPWLYWRTRRVCRAGLLHHSRGSV